MQNMTLALKHMVALFEYIKVSMGKYGIKVIGRYLDYFDQKVT